VSQSKNYEEIDGFWKWHELSKMLTMEDVGSYPK
jgi:hypothetical protein